MTAAQSSWSDYVGGQNLPWFAEEKVKLGAFAAFLGVTLEKEGQWRAVAIGDCCLFHARNGELVETFPLAKSADFNNFPYLLGSLKERNDGVFEQKQTKLDGQWASGDMFLLMSDALACWFLRCVEGGAGAQLIDWFTALDSHELFQQLVQSQRTHLGPDQVPNMKDDDVTLVKIQVGDDQAILPAVPSQAKIAPEKKSDVGVDGTMRMGAVSKSEASDIANATVRFSTPATTAKKPMTAKSTHDMLDKLAPSPISEQAFDQPTLRHIGGKPAGQGDAAANEALRSEQSQSGKITQPSRFTQAAQPKEPAQSAYARSGDADFSEQASVQSAASKAARRETHERAAMRQTHNDDAKTASPAPERSGGRRSVTDLEYPQQAAREIGAQTTGQRNIVIVFAVLVVATLIAGIALLIIQKQEPHSSGAPHVHAAGTGKPALKDSDDQGTAANGDADQDTKAPDAGTIEKHLGLTGKKKSGRASRHGGSSLRVPTDELPGKDAGDLDVLPADGSDKSIKFQKDGVGKPKLED